MWQTLPQQQLSVDKADVHVGDVDVKVVNAVTGKIQHSQTHKPSKNLSRQLIYIIPRQVQVLKLFQTSKQRPVGVFLDDFAHVVLADT